MFFLSQKKLFILLIFLIVNNSLFIKSCKSICCINEKNTSELDINLAPKNKNDNFIKLKKSNFVKFKKNNFIKLEKNNLENKIFNLSEVFTESGQPLKHLKNIKWENSNCCLLSIIRLFYCINIIYEYIRSTETEDIDKLFNEFILDLDKNESGYTDELEEGKNNNITTKNILITFKNLFKELKISNNVKTQSLLDEIFIILKKNKNILIKDTIDDIFELIFTLLFNNQQITRIKKKKKQFYDPFFTINIIDENILKIQDIIDNKIKTDLQKNIFIINTPNILVIKNNSRLKLHIDKGIINKETRLQISEFINIPIYDKNGKFKKKENYILKGVIFDSGVENNKSCSDFSCVVPVFDNEKNKLGYIYSALNEISDIYPLDYFNKCDNIKGFKYPHPIYIFFEKLNIN